MFDGYKVVACVPSGRERTMSLLMRHLRANRGLLDGVQLWENVKPFDDHTTTAQSDLDWIRSQADDFVAVIPLDDREPPRKPKQLNTGRFYRNTTDADTIYIRFDDDIIWLHPDAIRNLVRYRIAHQEPLAVFATIWNNAIVSALEQEAGNIDQRFGRISLFCMDDIAWKLPEFAPYIHELLLSKIADGTVEDLYLDPMLLVTEFQRRRGQNMALRFSVSCFAWFGAHMADQAEIIYPIEEEQYISFAYPNLSENYNHLCGDALVSHYSFFTQRPKLDSMPHILGTYRELADDAYHDAYYRLLDTPPEPYTVEVWWQHAE